MTPSLLKEILDQMQSLPVCDPNEGGLAKLDFYGSPLNSLNLSDLAPFSLNPTDAIRDSDGRSILPIYAWPDQPVRRIRPSETVNVKVTRTNYTRTFVRKNYWHLMDTPENPSKFFPLIAWENSLQWVSAPLLAFLEFLRCYSSPMAVLNMKPIETPGTKSSTLPSSALLHCLPMGYFYSGKDVLTLAGKVNLGAIADTREAILFSYSFLALSRLSKKGELLPDLLFAKKDEPETAQSERCTQIAASFEKASTDLADDVWKHLEIDPDTWQVLCKRAKFAVFSTHWIRKWGVQDDGSDRKLVQTIPEATSGGRRPEIIRRVFSDANQPGNGLTGSADLPAPLASILYLAPAFHDLRGEKEIKVLQSGDLDSIDCELPRWWTAPIDIDAKGRDGESVIPDWLNRALSSNDRHSAVENLLSRENWHQITEEKPILKNGKLTTSRGVGKSPRRPWAYQCDLACLCLWLEVRLALHNIRPLNQTMAGDQSALKSEQMSVSVNMNSKEDVPVSAQADRENPQPSIQELNSQIVKTARVLGITPKPLSDASEGPSRNDRDSARFLSPSGDGLGDTGAFNHAVLALQSIEVFSPELPAKMSADPVSIECCLVKSDDESDDYEPGSVIYAIPDSWRGDDVRFTARLFMLESIEQGTSIYDPPQANVREIWYDVADRFGCEIEISGEPADGFAMVITPAFDEIPELSDRLAAGTCRVAATALNQALIDDSHENISIAIVIADDTA